MITETPVGTTKRDTPFPKGCPSLSPRQKAIIGHGKNGKRQRFLKNEQ